MKQKAIGLGLVILTVFLSIVGLVYWRIDQKDQKQIKTTVLAYLHMKDVYATIYNETAAISKKSTGEEQDNLVRERILEAYRDLLTGQILKSYEDALQTYTIFSDDYAMLFSDLEKIKINKLRMNRKGPDHYLCMVSLVSSESYNTDLFAPELKTLIKDYQVTNFTQAGFNRIVNRCHLIKLEVKRKDTFKMTKTAKGWLIDGLKVDIEQSKLEMATNS
jgi:hypothetical protein